VRDEGDAHVALDTELPDEPEMEVVLRELGEMLLADLGDELALAGA
jgi:hypothetical protein